MQGSRRPENNTSLLGIGFDGEDGHKRITQGENFVLLGGSRETHEKMQHVAIRVNEKLKRDGRHMRDLSKDEFADLVRDSLR